MSKFWVTNITAWLLLSLVPATEAHGAPVYTIRLLPSLSTSNEPNASARAINNLGIVVGESTGVSATRLATLWNGGVPQSLGTLGYDRSVALSINDAGQIVGYSNLGNPNHDARGFLYSGGVMSTLDPLAGDLYSYAAGINNLGQVVGYSYGLGYTQHAVTWASFSSPTPLPDILGATDGSTARAINDSGQILGGALFSGRSDQSTVIWDNTTITNVGIYGADINNVGQVAGFVELHDLVPGCSRSNSIHAAIWSNGIMTDLGTLGGPDSQANAINNLGQVVGTSTSAPCGYGSVSAFLYSAGVIYDLADIMSSSDWTDLTPSDINDLGQIVGTGTFFENGVSAGPRAFIMEPCPTCAPPPGTVPEPTILALISVALLGVAATRIRRASVPNESLAGGSTAGFWRTPRSTACAIPVGAPACLGVGCMLSAPQFPQS